MPMFRLSPFPSVPKSNPIAQLVRIKNYGSSPISLEKGIQGFKGSRVFSALIARNWIPYLNDVYRLMPTFFAAMWRDLFNLRLTE